MICEDDINELHKLIGKLERDVFKLEMSQWRLELAACMNAVTLPGYVSTVKGYDPGRGKGDTCAICGKIIQDDETVQWGYTIKKGTPFEPRLIRTNVYTHEECLDAVRSRHMPEPDDDRFC